MYAWNQVKHHCLFSNIHIWHGSHLDKSPKYHRFLLDNWYKNAFFQQMVVNTELCYMKGQKGRQLTIVLEKFKNFSLDNRWRFLYFNMSKEKYVRKMTNKWQFHMEIYSKRCLTYLQACAKCLYILNIVYKLCCNSLLCLIAQLHRYFDNMGKLRKQPRYDPSLTLTVMIVYICATKHSIFIKHLH